MRTHTHARTRAFKEGQREASPTMLDPWEETCIQDGCTPSSAAALLAACLLRTTAIAPCLPSDPASICSAPARLQPCAAAEAERCGRCAAFGIIPSRGSMLVRCGPSAQDVVLDGLGHISTAHGRAMRCPRYPPCFFLTLLSFFSISIWCARRRSQRRSHPSAADPLRHHIPTPSQASALTYESWNSCAPDRRLLRTAGAYVLQLPGRAGTQQEAAAARWRQDSHQNGQRRLH
ncbi:hypothetical protein B0T16DRAFT_421047 [Cercophora newfieldiana]|uniref:Uncharacterized protein n=1 Tax=Cercophora newfieldiana TaxID=92897 RepID=A0AA40CKS8_9PEZI|nr:hypothetical protein B0T16DRAFT_421047 [Cercophora newfieldiana]